MGRLLAFVDLCLSMHGKDLRFAFAPDMSDRVNAIRQAMPLIERYRGEEALSTACAPEAARRIDLDAMRELLEKIDALALEASGIPGWAGLSTNASMFEDIISRADQLRDGARVILPGQAGNAASVAPAGQQGQRAHHRQGDASNADDVAP